MKNNRFLTSYFINKSFQFRFIAYSLFFTLLLSACFFVSAHFFFQSFQEMGRSAGFPEDHVFFRFMSKQQTSLYTNMIWSILFVSVLSVVYGIYQSHKIAGPIHRLKIELEKMKKNKELKKIQFRKKDFFKEVPESFNQMVESVKN